jgi:hypothetical protein
VECFFLHAQKTARLFADHPAIWKTPKDNSGNRIGSQGLQKFGPLGLIYECANYGGLGKYDEVKWVLIDEFFNYIDYQRISNERS